MRRERDAQVLRALAAARSDDRDAIVLAASGYRVSEIASRIGRTELATRALLCRARGRMRRSLDALEVHIDSLRLNRADGYTSFAVSPAVFNPGEKLHDGEYGMAAVRPGRGTLIPWDIDIEKQTVSPRLRPQDKSGWKIELPARPMLGCIGVAPAYGEVRTSGPSGNYGGNMDYNQLREGTTLYLPVFHEGALLLLGDGHAVQGDGELTGDALETSMDIDFTVDVIRNQAPGTPRAENAEYLMAIGIAGSLDQSLRIATTEMARWLESTYKLTSNESAMVLGSAVKYDVADLVSTQVSIVAKVPKSVLAAFASR